MDDFEKVRWKLADDLTTDEAQLIVDNQDKLNDEEKDAFADLLEQAKPLPDNPLDKALEEAGKEESKIEMTKPSEETPVTPPVVPQMPENVVTQDKLDSYLEEKRKEWEAEGKTKLEQQKEEAKITQLFDEGYTPKDWNDYSLAFLEKVTPIIEQKILAKLDQQNKEFQDNQDKMRKTQQEIYQRFEDEFKTLAKNKLIPDPAESPDDYKKVKDAIIKIGDANGKSNVTDAYKLWSIIPTEHGGGLVTGPKAPPVDPKAKIEAQKEQAGKIGSGRGAPSSKIPGPPSWNTIHNTRMEDLVEQRLRQP